MIDKLRHIDTMPQCALIKKYNLDLSLLAWRYVHNAFQNNKSYLINNKNECTV